MACSASCAPRSKVSMGQAGRITGPDRNFHRGVVRPPPARVRPRLHPGPHQDGSFTQLSKKPTTGRRRP
eukprot:9731293-Alexandrium_andersonii.AAC.1